MTRLLPFTSIFLLSSCTTRNDVDYAQAQALIEAARAGQLAAAGLADVARMQALSILIPVLLVAALVVYIIWSDVQARKLLKQRRTGQPAPRPQERRLPAPTTLTYEEWQVISNMRQRSAINVPPHWEAPYVDEEIDVWETR